MNILIVDDDTVIVEVIKDSVNWKSLGIKKVYTAFSAETGKKLLMKEKIDIVISDIEMPQESGLELLSWYRNRGCSGKFLLLTCHENFAYAQKALELCAADYLLKPFNVSAMELVLSKNIKLLEKERIFKERAVYGQWVLDHMEEVELSFFESLINGRIHNDPKTILENIQIRNFSMNLKTLYRFVVSRITNIEQDKQTYGEASLQFMIKNFHSQYLCGDSVNQRVLCYYQSDRYLVITICDEQENTGLLVKCRKLIQATGELLESTVTSCIGNSCRMEDFKETVSRLENIMDRNVIFYGQAFFENDHGTDVDVLSSVLDIEQLIYLLNRHEQKKIMDYLKKELETRVRLKMLDGRTLNVVRMEFSQAVYSYLTKHGIQVSKLFGGEVAQTMARKADQSVIDLLRWAGWFMGQAFSYEQELEKSQSLIEKVNHYIQEHYRENIGRNEIGAYFHMVPEYLAKIYKRKTEKTLKDAINEYRLAQAKELLVNPSIRVIDVAMEVGFDNISYFSTLFKKNTGLTPNEYRRQLNKMDIL